jgi:hypothetical protein
MGIKISDTVNEFNITQNTRTGFARDGRIIIDGGETLYYKRINGKFELIKVDHIANGFWDNSKPKKWFFSEDVLNQCQT